MTKTNKNNELLDKINELTNGWQRTQADFINYKNKVAEERSALIKLANLDLIYEILPVLDNFVLAAKHIPKELENNIWAEGIKQIEKQLESVLSGAGVSRIESVGTQFNPELHEVVAEVFSESPDGTILEEMASGYLFKGSVVRPAKVKIAKKKN